MTMNNALEKSMNLENSGTKTKKRVAIYVRVSTEEQAKHGYSLTEQLERCRAIVDQDSDIIEYIEDGVTGEFLERPELTRLREDVAKGLVDEVVCYDPDRWSRKLVNQLIITEEIEKKAKLTFVNHDYKNTPEGILFYQMRGAFAEFEKAKITERMSSGRLRKAKEGKVVKDSKLYGYKYNKEKCTYEIFEPEAKIVRLIFDLLVNPQGRVKGVNGIAHYLTDMGIPTKRGAKKWHRQVVRQILMNEAYTGILYQNKLDTRGMLRNKFVTDKNEKIQAKIRSKEEWIPVEIPAIIDRNTFEVAQRILGEARRRYAGYTKRRYLLSGLLRCGDCGNTMTGRNHKNWGKYIPMYTDMKNTAGAKFKGCNHMVECKNLDEFVWKHFLDVVTPIIHKTETVETTKGNIVSFEAKEMERITVELEKIAKQRSNLLWFVAQNADLINESDIRTQLEELKEKEERLLKAKDYVEKRLNDSKQYEISVENLKRVAELYLKEDSESLTVERKQELIRMIFKEIRVFKDGRVEFRYL